jgi:hypothetical protein
MSGTETIRRNHEPMKESIGTKLGVGAFGVILTAMIAFGFADRSEIRGEVTAVKRAVADRAVDIAKIAVLERGMDSMSATLNKLALDVTSFTAKGDRFTASEGREMKADFELKLVTRDVALKESVQLQLAKVLEALQGLKDQQTEAVGQRVEFNNRLALISRETEIARSAAERAASRVEQHINSEAIRPDQTGVGAPR